VNGGNTRFKLFIINDSVLSMITTGTPHKGTPFGRIYDYLQQNCLPESAHKNDNERYLPLGQVERSLSNRLDSQYLHHMKCYPNLLIHIY
jgi:hypothetical protein